MANSKQKALLAVIDGLGFNRGRSKSVVEVAWSQLDQSDKELIVSAAERIGHDSVWAKNLLYP
ncbi:MAG: hypothetical protein HOD62_02360, partial [Chloroflexi bacterium]|nr:hypothetical protein [Chloroflexota bacterium]